MPMELPTITMDPEQAAEKLEHFRRLKPTQLTEDDLATMAGYQALAAGNAVIDLAVAMRDAGLDDQMMPRLAIARADRKAVVFYGEWDGSGIFHARQERDRYIIQNSGICLPTGTWDARSHFFGSWFKSAYLPTIPPEHRPAPSQLRRYYVLWEAVWEPSPPIDPFLLKHLAGMLYVVLAQWDLTPLEQAVLRGRIAMEAERTGS